MLIAAYDMSVIHNELSAGGLKNLGDWMLWDDRILHGEFLFWWTKFQTTNVLMKDFVFNWKMLALKYEFMQLENTNNDKISLRAENCLTLNKKNNCHQN